MVWYYLLNFPQFVVIHMIKGFGILNEAEVDVFLELSHFFWASLVAQLVKNLPEMQETWVQSLGWVDPLEKGKATYSSILVWRISDYTIHRVTKSQT